MTTAEITALRRVRLSDGREVDLRIAGGRIAGILPAGTLAEGTLAEGMGAEGEDAAGLLALPPFVEAHIHLDKCLTGLPFQPHRPGASIAERIAVEKELRRSLPLSVRDRGRALVRQVAAFGTGHIRSHVDIDGELGLSGLEALLALREEVADLVSIQIVAFPQNGILRDPPVAGLLDAALAAGADLVGGLDPASIDGDVAGHLSTVFALAERHGTGIDIHLHDPGELGLFELRDIAARTEAAGLQGRVAVSHAFALGATGGSVDATIAALARAGVSIVTNGPSRAVGMPPVARLTAEGIRVVAGSDNIRDAWSPYGDGDMLRRASLIGYMQDLRGDRDLELALAMATTAGAALIGREDYGIAPGAPADLVLLRAGSAAEAVAGAPPREMVIRAGRVIARGGVLL